ncbi:MAG: hypothetical protein WBF90_04405 [Rivularia sp. (in: cyanobacteria)]
MKNKLIISGAITIALLNLTGCGKDNSSTANTTDTTVAPVETTSQNNQNSAAQPSSTTEETSEAPVTTSKPAITASNKTLAPGTYCYKANTKTINAGAEVNINSNNRVNGKIKGTSDFNFIGASDNYSRTFEGTLTGNKAKLTAETRIEVEILNYQGNWTITESSLITDKATYNKVDCSNLTLTSTLENDSALYNNPGDRTIRVKFDRGTSSKTVKDSVIRGTRDIYLLGANKGQQMNLNITSLEDNAVFDVVSPNGQTLQQEARNWSGKLPQKGDYQIVVGGTRGNATYELTTEIK